MKWNKAINQIETAMAQGKDVNVRYHRKWARNVNEQYLLGKVDSVNAYQWKGETCKSLYIYGVESLDEGNYIIDGVYWYTGSHSVGEIVEHGDHECRVTDVWNVGYGNGITIVPTGGYGFPVEIYDDQL